MANNVNTIISGLYAGAAIKKSSTGKAAYIIANGGYQYINQQNVDNITTVNKETVNNVMDASLGSAVFGAGGAVIGMNQKQILLEKHYVVHMQVIMGFSPIKWVKLKDIE